MFGRWHLLFMALTAGVVLWLFWLARQGKLTSGERWLKVIAVVIVCFDPIYWVWEWTTFGALRWSTTLPLYLCSLFWILLPVGVFSRPGWLKQTALANLATIGLITGLLGFVLNTYLLHYPFFSFVPLRSLSYHFFMITGSVLLWLSGTYRPQPGDQWRSFLPVGLMLIPSLILNARYGYDYGYTAGGIGTPIEILSRALPKPLFLLVLYGGFFLLIWLVFYRHYPLFVYQKIRQKTE